MTDSELLTLDKNGFIPGPNEEEKAFLARVASAKKKFEEGGWIPESHWDWVRNFLDELFNVKPLYICAFYSDRKLAPWQGAAAWIEGRKLDSVQLRRALKKGAYLRIYRREEVLAHEAVHAVRCGFDESRFEEFFAYMSSEKKVRRVLGPIVRRPWEIWPFLIALLGGIFFPLFYWVGSIWLALGFVRLIRNHLILNRAGKQVLKEVGDLKKMRSILLRLTDDEIEKFAKGDKFLTYAEKQSCLRWRVIQMRFLWQKKSS